MNIFRTKLESKMHITVIMVLLISVALSACSDNSTSSNSDEETLNEIETAFFVTIRELTPNGSVYYLGAYEDVPSTVNISEMVELGTAFGTHAFGEHFYYFSTAASTLTKYGIGDDLSITVEGIMSVASTGVSSAFTEPAFISETEAYFFALTEGKILEFNPTEMTITEIIDVQPTAYNNGWYGGWTPYVSNGKIILPLEHSPGDLDDFAPFAEVAVFDPSTNSFSINRDTRMSSGRSDFPISLNSSGNIIPNDFYYQPTNGVPHAETYGNSTGHPTTGGMLKVNSDGSFDPNDFVDLKDVLNANSVRTVSYIFDGKAVVSYHDSTFTPPADPSEWWAAEKDVAVVDLANGTYEPFPELENLGGNAFFIGTDKNGTAYFQVRSDVGDLTSTLFTLNGADDINVVGSQSFSGGAWMLVHQAR